MNVVLRGPSPGRFAALLRAAVSSVDRNIPVWGIATLSDIVSESIAQPKFLAILSVAFAGLAGLLASIGLYGVMAYSVSQQTTEIGVRMALGATRLDVFRAVVQDGLRLTALGLTIGIAGSLTATRWLTTLLYGVRPGDVATLAAAGCLLLIVSLVACVAPARRATRVDPMVAIRSL